MFDNTPIDKQPILVLITGGTLDKDYVPTTGELTFSHSHLPEMLQQANITLEVKLETLMLKDSLEISDVHRVKICEAIAQSRYRKIVVTHGTDTMTESAVAVENFLYKINKPKTVVFTGAMRPFKLGVSDASFNLGSALTAAQILPAGCFIAMNGHIHPAGHTKKNRAKGIFERLD